MEKLSTTQFFLERRGHRNADLRALFANTLLLRPSTPIVWLAGDSSLDNKGFVSADGIGGVPLPVSIPDVYTRVFKTLTPMKPDVAFWMNHHLGHRGTVINAACEGSLVRDRKGSLVLQDLVVRDCMREDDILVVSVGAGDVLLNPSPTTSFNAKRMARWSSQEAIEDGTAWSLSHFNKIFGKETASYIQRLTSTTKPRAVLVCMMPFPLLASKQHSAGEGWAAPQLKTLKYDAQPRKLQAAIRSIYANGTRKIQIPGTKVVPVPLFEVLDGLNEDDYVERVEPSVEGGRKISRALVDVILSVLDGDNEKRINGEAERGGREERVDSHSGGDDP